jgi:hypothetical protein
MKRMDARGDQHRPVGRVIGSFRSRKLGWTDEETGQDLELDAFGPESLLRALEPLGFETLSEDDPPGGGERALGADRMVHPDEPSDPARGASDPSLQSYFHARLSPEEFLSGPS